MALTRITGVDWDTGKTVHCTVFGKVTAGPGACALVQVLECGDMIFASVTGLVRIPLANLEGSTALRRLTAPSKRASRF